MLLLDISNGVAPRGKLVGSRYFSSTIREILLKCFSFLCLFESKIQFSRFSPCGIRAGLLAGHDTMPRSQYFGVFQRIFLGERERERETNWISTHTANNKTRTYKMIKIERNGQRIIEERWRSTRPYTSHQGRWNCGPPLAAGCWADDIYKMKRQQEDKGNNKEH